MSFVQLLCARSSNVARLARWVGARAVCPKKCGGCCGHCQAALAHAIQREAFLKGLETTGSRDPVARTA